MRSPAHPRRLFLLVGISGLLALAPLSAYADTILLPGTGVLLSQSNGGNGGNTSSTTSSTNIFSPAAYADYKRFGGEPTTVVDRYPLTTGTVRGTTCSSSKPCYPDYAYVSSPNGFVFPHYSTFFKSSDLGETFRTTQHFSGTDFQKFTEGGGGDGHIAIGQKTHTVFFVDLPADCVTVNQSTDFGESFSTDGFGCGLNPGAIDDRPWIAVDELNYTPGKAYVSFINFTNGAAPTLALALSNEDGANGTFLTDSPCNEFTNALGAGPGPAPGTTQAPNGTPTPCPDPTDSFLDVAGPAVVDLNKTHGDIYIPFIRATPVIPDVESGPPFSLWVAVSTNGGNSWTRSEVADLGTHDPVNIFPEMTVDNAGNLYYTWSQTQLPSEAAPALGGEQDVYYTYSAPFVPSTSNPPGTFNWVQPIDLTGEANDSAVFPWMVAGDPGQVDLVFYKANTGLNSNVAFVDTSGNPCDSSSCTTPNPSVWNVYFSQSQNALNSGANFKAVQISSQPNHLGQICTAGIGCTTGGNRDLLDFFTVDIDHLGAANITWADDNNRNSNTINRFSRQLSGNSVFKNQNISLQSSWPITDHAVSDPVGDVFDGGGGAKGSCPGMDLTGTREHEASGQLTITLSLVGPPTSANAVACTQPSFSATGGIWGAEFWANNPAGGHNFYLAYRDNPLDTPNPRIEDGTLDVTLNATLTALEFNPVHTYPAPAPSYSCTGSANTSPCTLTITVPTADFGIKDGAGLYSITGLSVYWFGTGSVKPPLLNYELGNSEQADVATAFDDNGTGTTTK